MHIKAALLSAIMLCAAGCIFTLSDSVQQDTLGYFEFFQHGDRVVPEEGILVLDRSPFFIRFTLAGWTPALIATGSWNEVQSLSELPGILTSVPGTGMAVTDNDLKIFDDSLEYYLGWSEQFEENWGATYDSYRQEYEEYRSGLSEEPILLMAGIDYNFAHEEQDKLLVRQVQYLEGIPIEWTTEEELFLILIMEPSDTHTSRSLYPLQWSYVTLRFRE
ncbi:MAG: hypothetical protein GF388_00060 [Candidatus Aegiribacteria sp.]|nr:hypothetical protein [Candidatus Aegiribacteria sp.]